MSAQINLYHVRFRRQRELLTLANVLVLSVVLATLAGAGGGWAWQQQRVRVAEADAATAQAKALREKVQAVTAAVTDRKPNIQLQADITNAEALLLRRVEIVQLLESGSVGSTSGFADHLRGFARQTRPGLWLTGFSIASDGGAMEIRGRMMNPDALPDYIRRLGTEKSFRGLSFATLNLSRPAPVVVAATGAPGAVSPAPTSPPAIEFRLQPTRAVTEAGKS